MLFIINPFYHIGVYATKVTTVGLLDSLWMDQVITAPPPTSREGRSNWRVTNTLEQQWPMFSS